MEAAPSPSSRFITARAIPTGQQACISALKQINPQVERSRDPWEPARILVKVTSCWCVPASPLPSPGITKSMTMITASSSLHDASNQGDDLPDLGRG